MQAVCSIGLNLFRVLMTYLQPVLPAMAATGEAFLQLPAMTWVGHREPADRPRIDHFTPLMTRVEQEKIDAMLEDSKENLAPAQPPAGRGRPLAADPVAETITTMTLRKSTCASRASSRPSTSRAPTSCCS